MQDQKKVMQSFKLSKFVLVHFISILCCWFIANSREMKKRKQRESKEISWNSSCKIIMPLNVYCVVLNYWKMGFVWTKTLADIVIQHWTHIFIQPTGRTSQIRCCNEAFASKGVSDFFCLLHYLYCIYVRIVTNPYTIVLEHTRLWLNFT